MGNAESFPPHAAATRSSSLDAADDDATATVMTISSKNASTPLMLSNKDILAHIAGFLERLDLNKAEQTCRAVHTVINDPRLVTKPWPSGTTFCPWRSSGIPPSKIVFSPKDYSRVAIYYEGIAELELTEYNHAHQQLQGAAAPGKIEVWDRTKGLLTTFGDCDTRMASKPVFSPDGEFLVFTTEAFDDFDTEYSVVSIYDCLTGTRSKFHLRSAKIFKIDFLNNETVVFLPYSNHQWSVKAFKINRDRSKRRRLKVEQISSVVTDRRPLGSLQMHSALAAFSDKEKEILAFYYDRFDTQSPHVIFYDTQSKSSVCRATAEYIRCRDLEFPPSGDYVLATSEACLVKFDLRNASSIDDIGPATTIAGIIGSLPDDRRIAYISSFLPNGNVAVCTNKITGGIRDGRVCIIDLEEEEVVADEVSSWDELVCTKDVFVSFDLEDKEVVVDILW